MRYTVKLYLNVADDGAFFLGGYRASDPLATADDLTLRVEASDWQHACERAWVVGNREGADAEGRTWPSDVRSVSVGDVAVFPDGPVLRCQSVGWSPSAFDGMRVVPLEGTHATSRERGA